MPDRQRHGGLSDAFARLFAARSRKSPATAGRHRGAAPAGPPGAGPAGHRPIAHLDEPLSGGPFASGPLWSDDPAATVVLSGLARELSDLAGRESHRPDPMADTMQLSRLAPPRPTTDPADLDSGSDTGPDADAGLNVDTDTDAADDDTVDTSVDAGPIRSRSARSPLTLRRRPLAMGAAGVVAVVALLALPPVRAQLRSSFTRLPQAYTALYFTSPPQVDGTVLTVPVSVHAVDTGTDVYSVRVWTVDAKGRVDDSRTAGLKWDGQAMSTVVNMPVNPAADYVWVSLGGSNETLHYKIAMA